MPPRDIDEPHRDHDASILTRARSKFFEPSANSLGGSARRALRAQRVPSARPSARPSFDALDTRPASSTRKDRRWRRDASRASRYSGRLEDLGCQDGAAQALDVHVHQGHAQETQEREMGGRHLRRGRGWRVQRPSVPSGRRRKARGRVPGATVPHQVRDDRAGGGRPHQRVRGSQHPARRGTGRRVLRPDHHRRTRGRASDATPRAPPRRTLDPIRQSPRRASCAPTVSRARHGGAEAAIRPGRRRAPSENPTRERTHVAHHRRRRRGRRRHGRRGCESNPRGVGSTRRRRRRIRRLVRGVSRRTPGERVGAHVRGRRTDATPRETSE